MAEEQVLPVLYVNAVKFVSNPYEISIALGISDPPLDLEKPDGPAEVGVRPYARVVMSPVYFKKFVDVAAGVLKQYEEKHGQIPVAK